MVDLTKIQNVSMTNLPEITNLDLWRDDPCNANKTLTSKNQTMYLEPIRNDVKNQEELIGLISVH